MFHTKLNKLKEPYYWRMTIWKLLAKKKFNLRLELRKTKRKNENERKIRTIDNRNDVLQSWEQSSLGNLLFLSFKLNFKSASNCATVSHTNMHADNALTTFQFDTTRTINKINNTQTRHSLLEERDYFETNAKICAAISTDVGFQQTWRRRTRSQERCSSEPLTKGCFWFWNNVQFETSF